MTVKKFLCSQQAANDTLNWPFMLLEYDKGVGAAVANF